MSGNIKAALVTGASSGIGFAIAEFLAREGYGLTVTGRKAEKLDACAETLRGFGVPVASIAADLSEESAICALVALHRSKFGRLDVLVNSAGVGFGQPISRVTGKRIDVQLHLNVRSLALIYREAIDALEATAREHRNVNVINLASITGKQGAAEFSVYSASKFAVVGFTQAINRELGPKGIKSTAICPALVDTPMTEFIKDQVGAETMIRTDDIVAAIRMVLSLSPACHVPEIVLARPGGTLDIE